MTAARTGVQRSVCGGRALRTACVLAVGAVLALTGCTVDGAASEPGLRASAAPASPAPTTPTTPTTDTVAPRPEGAAPARVSIPAIGVDESLIDLGLAADGSMEVPVDYDDVGWFTGGGRPGGDGPTVIAAHVDSPTGPAVFQRLDEVAVGDVVEVHDAEGGVHAYRVTETADYPKAQFPTARVFGATARDELRVITCGGIFDRDAGSYLDNRVVFAERV